MRRGGLWFRTVTADPSRRPVRLFCLPYAGGSAAAYRHWQNASTEVEVVAVQLPGRGRRTGEPPFEDARALAAELAEVLAPYLDRPYGIYGHSMGAVAGLALAHELARMPAARQPLGLFVGASVAPASFRTVRAWRGSDDELITWLAHAGGTPPNVLASSPLLRILLPTLRADLAMVQTYRADPGTRLAVPVVAFTGAVDPIAPAGSMTAWAEETDAGFLLSEVDGDHFFLADTQSGAEVLDSIVHRLKQQMLYS